MVMHPKWGTMIVGETCCDKLTQSTIGTEQHAEFLNYISRRKTFVNSPKWLVDQNGLIFIERAGIMISIVSTNGDKFRFNLNNVNGKRDYETLLDAQIGAFDFVESGKAEEYLVERRRKLAARNL